MKSFIVGSLAGILCTLSFIPQVIKIAKTKHTKDLSLATFSAFFVGISLWLAYGILIREWPVIIANAVTLILVLYIVIMKIKHG